MVNPCIGCGYCCISVPCDTSRRIYSNGVTQCPELEWNGERYICKLTTGHLSERYKEELYIGKGCCSNLNSWRKEVKPRREVDLPKNKIISLDPLFQKFLFSLSNEMISSDVILLTLGKLESILEKEGKSEEEIKSYSKEILHSLRSNRPSFYSGFIGDL